MNDYQRALKMEKPDVVTRTVIPAQPGWYVVRFMRAGEDHEEAWNSYLSYNEIVAWSIEMYAHHVPRDRTHSGNCTYTCIPLTIEGAADSISNPWAIKSPQGTYTILDLITLDTEEAALEELKKVDDEERGLQQKAKVTSDGESTWQSEMER
jgi:hypothetical protein